MVIGNMMHDYINAYIPLGPGSTFILLHVTTKCFNLITKGCVFPILDDTPISNNVSDDMAVMSINGISFTVSSVKRIIESQWLDDSARINDFSTSI